MAGRRPCASSNMAVLLQTERISSKAIESLLSPGPSYGEFHGTNSLPPPLLFSVFNVTRFYSEVLTDSWNSLFFTC